MVALQSIPITLKLNSEQNPQPGAQGKKIQRQFKKFWKDTSTPPPPPPAELKLAVPLMVPKYMNMITSNKAEQYKAIRDMALVVFSFLLWVGKHTYHKPSPKRQSTHSTVQSEDSYDASNTYSTIPMMQKSSLEHTSCNLA